MSKIFELFGYPVDTWDEKAWANLKEAHCPFMDAECDGGGNRFSSIVTLSQKPRLIPFFTEGKTRVQAGVCSLQLHDGEQPWIVCPRRLLNFRPADSNLQNAVKNKLYTHANLGRGIRYNVWSEVKMKCDVVNGEKRDRFDYTFDYVIAGRCRKSLREISQLVNKNESMTKRMLEKNGSGALVYKDYQFWYDDFPTLPLIIVEVMTSSTSGGDEKSRTQVSQVFEDTIYKLNHQNVTPEGPGINYRQVWARMVSQLLVKSQIGVAWGGKTFWVIQDLLAQYISNTTALNLNDFLSEVASEVNLIAGGYADDIDVNARKQRLIDIKEVKLYSGPVSTSNPTVKDFSDIVKLGCTPPIEELWRLLLGKETCASLTI